MPNWATDLETQSSALCAWIRTGTGHHLRNLDRTASYDFSVQLLHPGDLLKHFHYLVHGGQNGEMGRLCQTPLVVLNELVTSPYSPMCPSKNPHSSLMKFVDMPFHWKVLKSAIQSTESNASFKPMKLRSWSGGVCGELRVTWKKSGQLFADVTLADCCQTV